MPRRALEVIPRLACGVHRTMLRLAGVQGNDGRSHGTSKQREVARTPITQNLTGNRRPKRLVTVTCPMKFLSLLQTFLIVDHDPSARAFLSEQIRGIIPTAVSVEAENATTAKEFFFSHNLDGVFLNPGLVSGDAMSLVPELRMMGLPVVFASPHDHFALDAFDADAADYLLTPVDSARLSRAILRIRRATGLRGHEGLGDKLLVLSDQSHSWLIRQRDIILVEAEGSYAVVHVRGRKPILISRSLKEVEMQLSKERFLRANRNQIVQLIHLKSVKRRETGSFTGELEDGRTIEFSRRQSQAFRMRFGV